MDCENCSHYCLLLVFYGLTFVSLCTRWYLVFPLFGGLCLFSIVTDSFEIWETFLYTTIGLLGGVGVKYIAHTTRILPKKLLRHYHTLLVYFLELLAAPFIFWYIDEVVEETGFPIGLWTSLIIYVGWFIVVYNFNFRHEGMLEQSEVDIAHYNQTYVHWFLSLLPFYASSLFLVTNIIKLLIGMALLGIFLWIEKWLTVEKSSHARL